jgi:flagellar biosynthesis protein FlhF
MAEAMEKVRAELGEDAIIVSTQRGAGGQGVRITAAMENSEELEQDIQKALHGPQVLSPTLKRVKDALDYHGVPDRLVEKLLTIARGLDDEGPVLACAAALDAAFTFDPIPDASPKPIMLAGPPGTGKSLTLAKLAARARLAGQRVRVVSADAVRAGAMDQLRAFMTILEIDLHKARGAASLEKILNSDDRDSFDLTLIDSPGLNPFSPPDMAFLKSLYDCTPMDMVLVQGAGGDPVECWDIARAFAEVGATRLLATRLDMTRRLGGILAAAEAGRMKFCDVTINPHVADGLCPISPISLARLILPPDDAAELPPPPWADDNEVSV